MMTQETAQQDSCLSEQKALLSALEELTHALEELHTTLQAFGKTSLYAPSPKEK